MELDEDEYDEHHDELLFAPSSGEEKAGNGGGGGRSRIMGWSWLVPDTCAALRPRDTPEREACRAEGAHRYATHDVVLHPQEAKQKGIIICDGCKAAQDALGSLHCIRCGWDVCLVCVGQQLHPGTVSNYPDRWYAERDAVFRTIKLQKEMLAEEAARRAGDRMDMEEGSNGAGSQE